MQIQDYLQVLKPPLCIKGKEVQIHLSVLPVIFMAPVPHTRRAALISFLVHPKETPLRRRQITIIVAFTSQFGFPCLPQTLSFLFIWTTPYQSS
jgi:hypothetical protein